MKFFHLVRMTTGLSLGTAAFIARAADGPKENAEVPSAPMASASAARSAPSKPTVLVQVTDPSPRPAATFKVDLNTADEATLASLPSIGPQVAKAIVAARPFASFDDLNRLKGISTERLEQIRTEVMVATQLTGARPPDRSGPDPGKLDLNTANMNALEAIPSIGTDGAKAIIAARPFARIDDLDRVQGISAERLEQIRAQVTVASPPPAEKKLATSRHEKVERPLEPTGRTKTNPTDPKRK